MAQAGSLCDLLFLGEKSHCVGSLKIIPSAEKKRVRLGMCFWRLYYAFVFCLVNNFFKQLGNNNMNACMLKHTAQGRVGNTG